MKIKDEDFRNILEYGNPTGTISIQPHPSEILEVDPSIIAEMKARLKGEDLSNVYDQTDRIIDEVSLERERQKLKRVFSSSEQIRDAFSSIKNIRTIQEELNFEEINRELLKGYSFIKAQEQPVDEIDFYQAFLFKNDLITKKQRLNKFTEQNEFSNIFEEYRLSHFEILKITKEAIELNHKLLNLFNAKKLASSFDDLLKKFYGIKI